MNVGKKAPQKALVPIESRSIHFGDLFDHMNKAAHEASSKKLNTIQHIREYQVSIMNKPFMEFSYKTPLTKAQYIKMH